MKKNLQWKNCSVLLLRVTYSEPTAESVNEDVDLDQDHWKFLNTFTNSSAGFCNKSKQK